MPFGMKPNSDLIIRVLFQFFAVKELFFHFLVLRFIYLF